MIDDIVASVRHGTPSSPAAIGQRIATVERRRPGRPAHVSPELVGLLRFRPSEIALRGGTWDDRGPASGLIVATCMGMALWAGSAWLVGLIG